MLPRHQSPKKVILLGVGRLRKRFITSYNIYIYVSKIVNSLSRSNHIWYENNKNRFSGSKAITTGKKKKMRKIHTSPCNLLFYSLYDLTNRFCSFYHNFWTIEPILMIFIYQIYAGMRYFIRWNLTLCIFDMKLCLMIGSHQFKINGKPIVWCSIYASLAHKLVRLFFFNHNFIQYFFTHHKLVDS